MTPQPYVSVTLPVGQAFERMKKVLFQPFDLGRWFVIGFCAWLATLGERGGFHTGYNFGGHHGGGANFQDQIRQARDYVMSNLYWIGPVVLGVMALGFVIWMVVLFLSSRGRFMFLHCVALNTAEVRVPWYRYAAEGNSLFWVRLVLAFIGLVLVLLPLAGVVLVVFQMVMHQAPSVGGIFLALLLVLMLVVVALACWVVSRVLDDFIVPIQFLRRSSCTDAWRELKGLLAGNVSNLLVYLLFRIVLAMMITALVLTVVLVTCCLAGCLFAIPYLGTVALLPILVFERAYSLHYLAQFGPDYDVFAPDVAARR
jgi:hypothetical protein